MQQLTNNLDWDGGGGRAPGCQLPERNLQQTGLTATTLNDMPPPHTLYLHARGGLLGSDHQPGCSACRSR